MSYRLDSYKQILTEQGDDIFAEKMSNISSRRLDLETMELAMTKQHDSDELVESILGELYASITHIPAKKLFGDINMLVEHMMNRLGDSRFYIYLSVSVHCNIKSNTFLATMAMCKNNEMVKGFGDFICAGKPLYTCEINKDITDYVYLDDATFSGGQLMESIDRLGRLLAENARNCTLHIVIPYIHPSIMGKVMTRGYLFKHIEWYTTNTYPRPVSNALHTILAQNPDAGSSRIYSTLDKLLGIRRPTILSESYERSLFFTDLKVPDYISVYTAFLLDPAIILNGERVSLSKYDRELIKGCMAEAPTYYYASSLGNDCPNPIYKEQEWKNFAACWVPNPSY